MSDETTKEKQSFLSRTWVKVTAGVLGGTLILGGTFATGAMAGARFGDMGPNRAFAAVGIDDRQMQIAESGGREFRKHGAERGAGKQSTHSLRGLSDLSQEDRLDRVNEWLESLEIAPLEELPEDLAGTPEELQKAETLNPPLAVGLVFNCEKPRFCRGGCKCSPWILSISRHLQPFRVLVVYCLSNFYFNYKRHVGQSALSLIGGLRFNPEGS
jgi:hypothetical protein